MSIWKSITNYFKAEPQLEPAYAPAAAPVSRVPKNQSSRLESLTEKFMRMIGQGSYYICREAAIPVKAQTPEALGFARRHPLAIDYSPEMIKPVYIAGGFKHTDCSILGNDNEGKSIDGYLAYVIEYINTGIDNAFKNKLSSKDHKKIIGEIETFDTALRDIHAYSVRISKKMTEENAAKVETAKKYVLNLMAMVDFALKELSRNDFRPSSKSSFGTKFLESLARVEQEPYSHPRYNEIVGKKITISRITGIYKMPQEWPGSARKKEDLLLSVHGTISLSQLYEMYGRHCEKAMNDFSRKVAYAKELGENKSAENEIMLENELNPALA